MKNISILSLLFIGMLCGCTDTFEYAENLSLNARALVDDNSASSTNPTLLTNWENVTTIVLNNSSLAGVTAPWISGTSSTLSTDFRTDILKENGWKMLFHTFKDGTDPGQNYMCFYNQLTGFIKIFYYYENNSPATNALWYITEGSQQKTRLLNETEYLSVGDDSPPLTNIIIASNMGIGPLAGLTTGWNGFEFQVPYSTDYSNKQFTINAYNQTIMDFDLSGKQNLETIGTIVTKTNGAATPAHVAGIANVTGNMAGTLVSNLVDTLGTSLDSISTGKKVKFGESLKNLIANAATGNVKGLINTGLNLIFGKTATTTTYNSDVKLSTAGTIKMSGTSNTQTTSNVVPISLNLYNTINSTSDNGHFLGVWRLKKHPIVKQGRVMYVNSPQIIHGNSTSNTITVRGTVQFPPISIGNVEVEINPDIAPYVTDIQTSTSILYCDSLQGSPYKSGVLEPRYLENGVRLLYSDNFNKFWEINPGEDRMTYTFTYSKANVNDPLPYNYFYDWGDATEGHMLLVVKVKITYNYQGKQIVVNQSRTYAPTYVVDENYGTRPSQVHTPPYSVIVNYNQPYLN